MQHYCKTIGTLAAATALVAGIASAEPIQDVNYELHTGYTTEYIWRGVEKGDNLTEAGFDATGKYNDIALSGGVWAGYFQAPQSDDFSLETDFYGEVAYDTEYAKLAVGYIYYWNAGNLGVDNQEIYFSASHDFGYLTASFTYFWDIIENQGGNNGYSELTLSHSWELSPCLNLSVGTTLGMHLEDVAATHWVTKAALDWGFAEHAKLSPFIGFSLALDEDARTIWADTSNQLFGGAMLSVSF